MLIDFQNYYTDRFTSKFATKSSLPIPPHLKHVATLPCEISVFKKLQFPRPKRSMLSCKSQPLKKQLLKNSLQWF